MWSSRAGQVFGWILIGLGLFVFLTGRGWGGLWFALIGWFLDGELVGILTSSDLNGVLRPPDAFTSR